MRWRVQAKIVEKELVNGVQAEKLVEHTLIKEVPDNPREDSDEESSGREDLRARADQVRSLIKEALADEIVQKKLKKNYFLEQKIIPLHVKD